jgi:hypothetical protein
MIMRMRGLEAKGLRGRIGRCFASQPLSLSASRPFILSTFIVLLTVAGLVASPARAQNKTTSANMRAAVKFAADQGFCTVQPQSNAQCKLAIYRCDNSKWASFISDHVDFCGSTACKTDKKSDVQIPQEVVNYLNKDVKNRSQLPVFQEGDCFCLCGDKETQEPCVGKPAETPFLVKKGEFLTREECEAVCSPREANHNVCAGHLAPIEAVDSGSAAGQSTAKAEALQMTCFNPEECAKQDGVFEAFGECRGGKGRCYAQAPVITLNVPFGGVAQVRGFDEYIVTAYRYLLSVLVVVVTVMFIYGAFRYLVGSSIGGVQRGKQIMVDAVIGMLLVLSATTILRTINPALTNLNPLKVYMINTAQYVSSIYCKDLPSGMKLADAGPTGKTMAREDVDKAKNPYQTSVSDAVCGRSYFIDGAAGNPCEGSVCGEKGKACVSCAGAEFSECKGVSGTYNVCAKLEFGGNVHYDNGHYPTDVYLVLACGYAKNPKDVTVIRNNLNTDQKGSVNKGAVSGVSESQAGTASFHVDVNEMKLSAARNACSGGGNSFLGGFIAVKYNGGGTAVLAASKCIGGGGKLSGYANGSDIPKAYQCAINSPNADFENPGTAYWTYDQLTKAASGDTPIVCNFNLDDTSAPTDPATKPGYCAAAAGGAAASGKAAPKTCVAATKTGSACSLNGDACVTSDQKTCTCYVAPVLPMGGGFAPPAATGLWTCK